MSNQGQARHADNNSAAQRRRRPDTSDHSGKEQECTGESEVFANKRGHLRLPIANCRLEDKPAILIMKAHANQPPESVEPPFSPIGNWQSSIGNPAVHSCSPVRLIK